MNPLAHTAAAQHNPRRFITANLLPVVCAILFIGCALFHSGPDGLEVSPDGYTGMVRECYEDARTRLASIGWKENLGDDPDISVAIREDGIRQSDGHLRCQMSTGVWAGGWATITKITVVRDYSEYYTRRRCTHEWAEIILDHLGVKTSAECHAIMKLCGIPTRD